MISCEDGSRRKLAGDCEKLVTSKPVTENVKERTALPYLKRVRSPPFSVRTAPPPRGGGVAEKNHNLKRAKAKNFCKTPSYREMNTEYQELFSEQYT